MAERFDYETYRRKGNHTGKITAYNGGRAVGHLILDRAEGETSYPEPGEHYEEADGQGQLFDHQQGPNVIDSIVVEGKHQRKGVGRDMLHLAESQFGPTMYSAQASPEGFQWAQKHGVELPVTKPTIGSMKIGHGDVPGRQGTVGPGRQPVGSRTVKKAEKGPVPVQGTLL